MRQAAGFHQQGKLREAEQLYQAVLKVRPDYFDALHFLGVLRAQQGSLDAAVELISRALERKRNFAEAHFNLGITLAKLNRYDEAMASYDRALQIKPDYAEALYDRGLAFYRLSRHEEAIASYDRALKIKPGNAATLNNRGIALYTLSRHEEAIASYDSALKVKPDYADALNNRGNVLQGLNRHEEAIACYDTALKINPEDADALNNRGNAFLVLNRHEEAIANFDRALRIRPNYAAALNNRGNALRALNRHEEAIASYDKALQIKPGYAEALYNRGNTLQGLNRNEEAIASYDRALEIRPDDTDALTNRGNALQKLKRHEEAIASFERALGIKPDCKYAFGAAAYSRAHICDWGERELTEKRLVDDVRSGKLVCSPFSFLSVSHRPVDQLVCATNVVRDRYPAIGSPVWKGKGYRHDRIRVAYLSADFHDHATAYLMAGLFERHDRALFETTAVSFGPDGPGNMRSRLKRAFERFIDVREKSDREIAALIQELEIDIAVDLKGFTTDSRTGIFAFRPAPIQVSYLGYPGTMGAGYIDYIIADEFVIPRDQQICYSEKVVYLPDCYQVNDSRRAIGECAATRADMGLPEKGVVFCCFNNSYKLTPQIFDIWMRLLQQVEHSVLWLFQGSTTAESNLRREAKSRGVDPERLVFAPRMKLDQHLARHRLADLFLDTLPYNAHTTASDALWTGLPVITCAGTTFAGRVAGSLLMSLGLAELAASTLKDYEALALNLATHPALLLEIREKLARNRSTAPLFDTERFRRHIEAAYTTMRDICQRGEEPRTFAVVPDRA